MRLSKEKKKSRKKKERDGLMQRMSRGRDQWQLNAHRLDSLDCVTTRSNGQEGLHSRTRSSTRVNLAIFFLLREIFFFLKKKNPNDNFWTHSFWDQNMFPPPKKGSKENVGKKTYMFLERFFNTIFLFGKTDTRKKRSEKEEKRDSTTIEKIKGHWKIEKSFCSK